MLRAQFGTDFASSHIGVYTLSVPAAGSEEALMRLLHRCQLDDAASTTTARVGDAPGARTAPTGARTG
jgi:hypothetical protein